MTPIQQAIEFVNKGYGNNPDTLAISMYLQSLLPVEKEWAERVYNAGKADYIEQYYNETDLPDFEQYYSQFNEVK